MTDDELSEIEHYYRLGSKPPGVREPVADIFTVCAEVRRLRAIADQVHTYAACTRCQRSIRPSKEGAEVDGELWCAACLAETYVAFRELCARRLP